MGFIWRDVIHHTNIPYLLGMTKVKMSKEESNAADFIQRRRAALERSETLVHIVMLK